MAFNDELMTLVNEVADRADRWTGHDAWTFEPDSPASAEVANTEMRLDGSPWGERPVRTVYQYAQMETKLAVELSRCAALLIGAARPAPGIEAVTRASLEAGSVVWWLLAEGLTARQQVCRMQLLRRNSAREYARSIKEVGEDLSVAGKETVAGIEAECRALGLAAFTQKGDELEGQTRPGYTARGRPRRSAWPAAAAPVVASVMMCSPGCLDSWWRARRPACQPGEQHEVLAVGQVIVHRGELPGEGDPAAPAPPACVITSWPSTQAGPASGASRVASIRTVVVLPAP